MAVLRKRAAAGAIVDLVEDGEPLQRPFTYGRGGRGDAVDLAPGMGPAGGVDDPVLAAGAR